MVYKKKGYHELRNRKDAIEILLTAEESHAKRYQLKEEYNALLPEYKKAFNEFHGIGKDHGSHHVNMKDKTRRNE